MEKNVVELEKIAEIWGGQTLSRLKKMDGENVDAVPMNVVKPGFITEYGIIETSRPEPVYVEERIAKLQGTRQYDIIIKLSTPFDAGIVEHDSAGWLVPSFCASIRITKPVDPYYVLAFLNSTYCKDQLQKHSTGFTSTMVTVDKIRKIQIPLLYKDEKQSIEIVDNYKKMQDFIRNAEKMMKLLQEKNDVLFEEVLIDDR